MVKGIALCKLYMIACNLPGMGKVLYSLGQRRLKDAFLQPGWFSFPFRYCWLTTIASGSELPPHHTAVCLGFPLGSAQLGGARGPVLLCCLLRPLSAAPESTSVGETSSAGLWWGTVSPT